MSTNTSDAGRFGRIHQVHVIDTVPAYRAGLVAHLRHEGLDATDDPPMAGEHTDDTVVLVAHTGRDEADLASIQNLARTGHLVLALVTTPEIRAHAAALLAGATGTVPWDAEPHQIAASLLAIAAGQATIPPAVAATLAERVPQGFPDGWLSTQDTQLIQAISDGLPVTAIAADLGLGQRSTHRLLADLYTKLGATTRLEAIRIAQRRGIID